ncbi:MAG: hypothetical protein K1Y36_21635 [Blastocatellia bacterium]|nr:hypothetical protein [Blastocatellia bacterium]
MKVSKGTLLKVIRDEFELPSGVDRIEFDNDGSTRVKLFGDSSDILHEKAKAMRDFFYQKPHLNDVASALITLGATYPDDDLADAIVALNRRKPRPHRHSSTDEPDPAEVTLD